MTMTTGREDARSIRIRLLQQVVSEQIDRCAAALGDPSLASLRITVNLRGDGTPRSVVVEPQLRVELTHA